MGAVVAVVVIVVIVLALLLAGIIPGLHSSSGPSSSGTGEASASASAQNLANSTTGGPWSVFEIAGVDATVGENIPAANLTNASCPLQGGSVSSISVPSYTGAYSNGAPEDWLFGFDSTSAATTLLVWVHGGTASSLGELTGTGCESKALSLPTNLISTSTAAADAVATANGTKFVHSFSAANATYLAENRKLGSESAAYWYVEFSACSRENYTSFDAVLNGTTGAITVANYLTSNDSSLCGAKAPLGSAFALGVTPSNPLIVGANGSTYAGDGCAATHYCYVLSVEAANPGLTVSDLNFELKTATGAVFTTPNPGGVSFLAINGSVVAQSPATAAGGTLSVTSWALGGDLQVTSILTIIIDTGLTTSPAGNGLVFEAIAVADYTGTVSVSLP